MPDTIADTGGTLQGPLILSRNPVDLTEAATKSYVDSAVSSISETILNSGIIPIGRLPAFTGDLVSNAGSNVLNLNDSNVPFDTYTCVTVNQKGFIVDTSTLLESDIPNLDWSKITTGKPTTLDGYGITDGIPLSGVTMTGELVLHADPVNNNNPVTKSYVDNSVSSFSGFSTGAIIFKQANVTPTGFLKCNGAYVSKTIYNNLYNVIGDTYEKYQASTLYTNYSAIGNGKPWKNQYDLNSSQYLNVTGFAATPSAFPISISNTQVLVTKNYVYVIGGYNGTTYISSVYYAVINADGTLGTWTTGTSLPINVGGSQVVVTKNRVYLIGGFDGTNYLTAVYTAPINTNGTLGDWVTAPSLPVGVAFSAAVVTKNRIYILGGMLSNTTHSSSIYSAVIGSSGSISPWTSNGNLPITLSSSQATIIKNKVYLFSGFNGVQNTPNMYMANLNSDGTIGDWTTLSGTIYSSGSSTLGVSSTSMYVTRNKIHLFGGNIVSTAYSKYPFSSVIDTNGGLGSWLSGSILPALTGKGEIFAVKDKLYLLGGFNQVTTVSTIYVATITGGMNDYSAYYDGTINKFDGNNPSSNPSPSTQFALPDFYSADVSYLSGSYSFIKY